MSKAKQTSAKKPAGKPKAPVAKRSTKKATAKKKGTAKKATVKKAAVKKPAATAKPKPKPAKPAASTVELGPGDRAPSFELDADDGARRSLRGLAGQRFVLYFYPRDSTPGCTTEAQEFSELGSNFDELGVPVLGVSTDSLKSHAKFRDKYGLTVRLLADPDAVASRAFGAWGSKQMYGKPVVGMIRTTFVIGPNGRIERKYVVRKAAGHAASVLADIQAALEPVRAGGRKRKPGGEDVGPQLGEDDSPEDTDAGERDAESDDDLDDASDLP